MSLKTLYLCGVAKGDTPIYEAHLTGSGGVKLQKDDLIQFICHSALDAVDQKVWTTTSMYLKDVDKFNDLTISGFCTAGRTSHLITPSPSHPIPHPSIRFTLRPPTSDFRSIHNSWCDVMLWCDVWWWRTRRMRRINSGFDRQMWNGCYCTIIERTNKPSKRSFMTFMSCMWKCRSIHSMRKILRLRPKYSTNASNNSQRKRFTSRKILCESNFFSLVCFCFCLAFRCVVSNKRVLCFNQIAILILPFQPTGAACVARKHSQFRGSESPNVYHK